MFNPDFYRKKSSATTPFFPQRAMDQSMKSALHDRFNDRSHPLTDARTPPQKSIRWRSRPDVLAIMVE